MTLYRVPDELHGGRSGEPVVDVLVANGVLVPAAVNVVGHVNYCTVHHNIEDMDGRCYDSFLPGDCVFTIAMIVLPEDTP